MRSTWLRLITGPSATCPEVGIAHGKVLRLGHQLFGQRIDDFLVRDDEAGGHADLALVEPGAERNG
jgi:hypothetical protein